MSLFVLRRRPSLAQKGSVTFFGEPLFSSPTAGEALPQSAAIDRSGEKSGGAERREIDSSGTSGGGVEERRQHGSISAAASQTGGKQTGKCVWRADEGCSEMREESLPRSWSPVGGAIVATAAPGPAQPSEALR